MSVVSKCIFFPEKGDSCSGKIVAEGKRRTWPIGKAIN